MIDELVRYGILLDLGQAGNNTANDSRAVIKALLDVSDSTVI